MEPQTEAVRGIIEESGAALGAGAVGPKRVAALLFGRVGGEAGFVVGGAEAVLASPALAIEVVLVAPFNVVDCDTLGAKP